MCFSRVRPDHPRCRSATWICMCGHTRDPIIYSEFHRNPFRGFGAPGGQNLAFPITLASRFYNSLYYRTSRDNILINPVFIKTILKVLTKSVSTLTPSLFIPGLKPTRFTNPIPVVPLLPPGLPSRTFALIVSSELIGFCF